MGLIFKFASTKEDFEKIYEVRHKILVKEEGFIPCTIEMESEDNAIHLMAIRDGKTVGVITLILDDGRGLPIEEYFDLAHIKKSRRAAEFRRFAVLPKEKGTETSVGLMTLAYEVAKKKGVKLIFIDLFKRKERDQKTYERMGFKMIGGYQVFNSEIVIMGLDIDKDAVYEISKEKAARRKVFVESLNKSPELKAFLTD